MLIHYKLISAYLPSRHQCDNIPRPSFLLVILAALCHQVKAMSITFPTSNNENKVNNSLPFCSRLHAGLNKALSSLSKQSLLYYWHFPGTNSWTGTNKIIKITSAIFLSLCRGNYENLPLSASIEFWRIIISCWLATMHHAGTIVFIFEARNNHIAQLKNWRMTNPLFPTYLVLCFTT